MIRDIEIHIWLMTIMSPLFSALLSMKKKRLFAEESYQGPLDILVP
jgi:hypothetical protein